MKSFIIDTNCLLSYVTDRNPRQYECMDKIFKNASNLEQEIIIISNVITEFVYVLQSIYKIKDALVSEMISDLLNNPGITYHHGYFPELIFKYWPYQIRDYGDAVIAASATILKTPVYTFDKSFAQQLKKQKINFTLL